MSKQQLISLNQFRKQYCDDMSRKECLIAFELYRKDGTLPVKKVETEEKQEPKQEKQETRHRREEQEEQNYLGRKVCLFKDEKFVGVCHCGCAMKKKMEDDSYDFC